ncbi:MAG: rRNA (uracil1939-C5)-methyltransferase, partial [Gaiellales bacterium]|nr:rRNA (uracil1939-C5)-methyltransferase [Gaiellales bacterium]
MAVPALVRDQELELTIDSLAYGGRGVARHGDLVVFVARALPGDRVRVRVTKFKKRYAEARAVELLEPGPGRVIARCAHFGVCGGCAWQDLEYGEQLRHKQSQVVDALERLGRLDGFALEPIEPAVSIWGYRNKFEYSWSQTEAGASLGFHVAGRWDRLMAVETCHIASEPSNRLRRAFETWAREHDLHAYDQRGGRGFLRHLVVREGRRTGQLLAMLVTAPGEVPGVERLSELLGDGVVGVVHAVNDGVSEITSGLESRTLFGSDEFDERVLDLSQRQSAGAIMHKNTEMCDVLNGLALEYSGLRP